ncbi:formylglycine-generating enzyme family protein [Phycisphaerales bacterium AB-hyl4]|uniref:Formylglycine-generating enzyme family protein n=1 Tax=Natronomicrosphaera hydrolytica TaxID=3242702 RepID=A0ABV4U5T7_9BACT
MNAQRTFFHICFLVLLSAIVISCDDDPFAGVAGEVKVRELSERKDWRVELDVEAPDWDGDEHVNSLGMKMKRIPAGRFKRGSVRINDAQPVREIEVSEFWIGAHEVTNEQYETFRQEHREWRSKHNLTDTHPVLFITWDDAMAFCAWLSEKEGVEYRLPTEAEWEYAARGGVEDKPYPWGDEPVLAGGRNVFSDPIDADAIPENLRAALFPYSWQHLDDEEDGQPISDFGSFPVGSFSPNGFGLYDMVGNAEEHCWDRRSREYYETSPDKDPKGPMDQIGRYDVRIHRGGSYRTFEDKVDLVAQRNSFRVIRAGDTSGFRVVVSSEPWGLYEEDRRDEIPGFPDLD